MEDRRRQGVAFDNVAKEMLRYLERIESGYHGTAGTIGGITLQQVAQQARNEKWSKGY